MKILTLHNGSSLSEIHFHRSLFNIHWFLKSKRNSVCPCKAVGSIENPLWKGVSTGNGPNRIYSAQLARYTSMNQRWIGVGDFIDAKSMLIRLNLLKNWYLRNWFFSQLMKPEVS